jgi:hypothetical protein
VLISLRRSELATRLLLVRRNVIVRPRLINASTSDNLGIDTASSNIWIGAGTKYKVTPTSTKTSDSVVSFCARQSELV